MSSELFKNSVQKTNYTEIVQINSYQTTDVYGIMLIRIQVLELSTKGH